jgi:hypothetical protein
MMGVYTRGKKRWIRIRDVGSTWRDASTGYEVGEEALARRRTMKSTLLRVHFLLAYDLVASCCPML